MKIFRWILSNMLLLVVVWTLVYVYLNWDEVKDDMPESVTNLVTRFQHKAEEAFDTTQVETPVAEHDVQVEPEQQPVLSVETETVAEVVVIDEEPSSAATVQPDEDMAMDQAAPPVDVAIMTEGETVEAISDQEPVTSTVVAVPQGIAAARPVKKHELDLVVRSELIQAREAFWHRDLAKAETLYSDLTTKQSDNPDIWGELGNVYLAQNKVKEAADAYYKAAEILIDEGRLRQVGQLMGVIQMAEPAKAQALDQKIQELYQQPGTMR